MLTLQKRTRHMSRSSKKNRGAGLGKAILKERNRGKRSRGGGGSWLHTSELDDGYDWNKLNLRSVTEESRLDEFLRTAELAGTEFTAEKRNIQILNPTASRSGLPSLEEEREIEKTHSKFRQLIGIPRRPEWGPSTTAEELELAERESYVDWRRNLAKLEEEEGLIFTPFEKNVQFWRQLWRVIEMSDVIVQIVDARNPLLFHCEDLDKYVNELSDKKVNLLLISKADLLSWQQRLSWAQYMSERGIRAAFWSAQVAENETKTTNDVTTTKTTNDVTTTTTTTPPSTTTTTTEYIIDDVVIQSCSVHSETETKGTPSSTESGGTGDMMSCPKNVCPDKDDDVLLVCPELLSRERLLQLFLDISPVKDGEVTTVGLVGYPNVGKSSTINVLYQEKKVPVSATPGRTKHFQTLYVTPNLVLCDCPGLVFPTLVSTKAEMVVGGILSIDQMRDHTPPVSLVCQRIPRSVLERVYGLSLPQPSEGEDPTRYPTAHELLTAYGNLHGYMTSHGVADCSRSARYILKDYVNGKLLYCHPPPGVSIATFNPCPPEKSKGERTKRSSCNGSEREQLVAENELSEFDRQFLKQNEVRMISKGCPGVTRNSDPKCHHSGPDRQGEGEGEGEDGLSEVASVTSSVIGVGKPWKRHHNRNKKEKTRRTNLY